MCYIRSLFNSSISSSIGSPFLCTHLTSSTTCIILVWIEIKMPISFRQRVFNLCQTSPIAFSTLYLLRFTCRGFLASINSTFEKNYRPSLLMSRTQSSRRSSTWDSVIPKNLIRWRTPGGCFLMEGPRRTGFWSTGCEKLAKAWLIAMPQPVEPPKAPAEEEACYVIACPSTARWLWEVKFKFVPMTIFAPVLPESWA